MRSHMFRRRYEDLSDFGPVQCQRQYCVLASTHQPNDYAFSARRQPFIRARRLCLLARRSFR